MRATLARLTSLFTLVVCLFAPQVASAVVDGPALLTSCVNAINDPLYTKSTLPVIILGSGKTQSDLESAISAGTYTVWIATGAGAFGASASSFSKDIFCGDINNNTVSNLDANSGEHDFFFGGPGIDSVTTGMWDSTFYGGLGNDYAASVQEYSVFNGGPGYDSYGAISTGTYASTFNQGSDIVSFSSFTLAGNPTSVPYRTSIAITASLDTPSKVTFSDAGKRIARCLNVTTTQTNGYYNAVCNWSPTRIGYTSLAAVATPIITATGNSFSMSGKLFVYKRSGNR